LPTFLLISAESQRRRIKKFYDVVTSSSSLSSPFSVSSRFWIGLSRQSLGLVVWRTRSRPVENTSSSTLSAFELELDLVSEDFLQRRTFYKNVPTLVKKLELWMNSEVEWASGLGNGGIRIGINYLVLNKTKWYEWWLNTKDFRLVNYLFTTRNICSKIGQIVTKLPNFSTFKWIAKFSKSWTYWVTLEQCIYK